LAGVEGKLEEMFSLFDAEETTPEGRELVRELS
jgi:hypothetical protein